MPEVEEAEYLLKYWHDAGTVGQGGMGITPLSWQEIRAWRLERTLRLEDYEITAIRALSCDYVSEYHAGTETNRPPPFEYDESCFDSVAAGNKIKNVLRGLTKKEPARYTSEPRE